MFASQKLTTVCPIQNNFKLTFARNQTGPHDERIFFYNTCALYLHNLLKKFKYAGK